MQICHSTSLYTTAFGENSSAWCAGVFKAPRNGIYEFSFSGYCHERSVDCSIDVEKNGIMVLVFMGGYNLKGGFPIEIETKISKFITYTSLSIFIIQKQLKYT